MLNISNISLIFLSLLCIQQSLCETPSEAPTYNNIYNPQVAVHPQIEVHPQINITNSSAFSVKVGDITLQCIQKIQDTVTREKYNALKDLIAQRLWECRYYVATGTILGAYCITSTLLLADYYYTLHNNAIWAHWKPECNFECLCSIPQKDLTHDLLCAINKQYYNKNHPTDFAHPLITFIKAIDTEIKTCKRYINLTKNIKCLHLVTIFPTNENKIEKVNQLLERALFIKHLFLSWLAEYNIANNQKYET